MGLKDGYEFYDIRNNKGLFRNLVIRNSNLGEWMVTLIFGEKSENIPGIMSELVETFPDVYSWHYIINEKLNDSIHDQNVVHYSGQENIFENLGHINCQIGPKSFFQTNSYQAKRLYDIAMEYAELKSGDILYDLYTGTGSIALYAARLCKKAIGIEQIPEAIYDARKKL